MTSLDYQWLSVVARRLKVSIKGFSWPAPKVNRIGNFSF